MSIAKLYRSWGVRIGLVCAMLPAGAFLYLKLSGQLNPGPVSAMQRSGALWGGYESHASFEKECKHCHAPVHCITANRCQTCHHDIAEQRASGQGLHALLPGTDKCQTCHIEHQGRDAVISHVSLINVDHYALTGFSLAHHQVHYDGTPVTCEDCHTGGTFAAASVDCLSCHLGVDALVLVGHGERFGSDCLTCHDGIDRMTDFEHQQVFALEGAHLEVACETCHQELVFAGAPRDCAGCHEEPLQHAGLFGVDCARCHGALAWAPAQLSQHVFVLDHGDAGVQACTVCHVTTFAAYRCDGCHVHEVTVTQARHAAANVDIRGREHCGECHRSGSQEELSQLRGLYLESRLPNTSRSAP